MKIDNYQFPKSSFLSVEKDFSIIIKKLLQSERLKKLLYYNTPDALKRNNLTQEQTLELIEKNIRIVPKYQIEENLENYLVITFDNFSPSSNPEFRDNLIMIDIVCHVEQWNLQDFQLRPFKIAGEIDALLNGAKLTGIGTLEFCGMNQITINSDYISECLVYQAVHGADDQKHPLSPVEEASIITEYNNIHNNDR